MNVTELYTYNLGVDRNVFGNYPGYASLEGIGYPEYAVDIYGNVINTQTGNIQPCDANGETTIHYLTTWINTSKILRQFSNKQLCCYAWWDRPETEWKNSPYAENIRICRFVNTASSSASIISNDGLVSLLPSGHAYHRHLFTELGYKYKDTDSLVVLFEGKTQKLSRLIAKFYVPIPEHLKDIDPEKLMVDFKDRNPKNCAAWNLMWLTKTEYARRSKEVLLSENEIEKIYKETRPLPEKELQNFRITVDGRIWNSITKTWLNPTDRYGLYTNSGKCIRITTSMEIINAWSKELINVEVSDNNPYSERIKEYVAILKLSKSDYKVITSEIVPWLRPTSSVYVVTKDGNVINWTKKTMLSKSITRTGYYRVSLPTTQQGGGPSAMNSVLIHVIMAKAFVSNPNPQKYTKIKHIDGNKLNDTVTNLQWVEPWESDSHFKTNNTSALPTTKKFKFVKIFKKLISAGFDDEQVASILEIPKQRVNSIKLELGISTENE